MSMEEEEADSRSLAMVVHGCVGLCYATSSCRHSTERVPCADTGCPPHAINRVAGLRVRISRWGRVWSYARAVYSSARVQKI